MAAKDKAVTVLLKLLHDDLITSDERERVKYLSDVVEFQHRKSLEVMHRTAHILKTNECLTEYKLLKVYTVLVDLKQSELVTCDECEMLNEDKGMFGSATSPEMMVKTARLLEKKGFEKECKILEDHALLTMLQQAKLITREEREGLTDPSDVAKIQSSKSSKVMDDTACIMRKFKHQRFQKASSFLSVLLELQQANLITSEERERLKNLSDLVHAQCGKPFEELAITVDLLRRYGCNEEFDFLAVIFELQQADLISSEDCKKLTDISRVVGHQREASPDTMIKTAEVLRKHGHQKMSKLLLVSAVTPELRNAKLITREESEMLNDLSDLVGLQYSKSPEEMAKTADILRSYGFNGECKLLQVHALLAELEAACLINTIEQKRMRDPVDVVRVQSGDSKTVDIMLKTADCLKKCGFEKESKVITVRAVSRELQQANLITSEECKMLRDISDVVKVLNSKSSEDVAKTADALKSLGLDNESRFLSVLIQLQDNSLITSEEREAMSDLDDVLKVQRCKSSTMMFETAETLKEHGFQDFESQFLSALTDLRQADLITSEQGRRLSVVSDVVAMQWNKSLEMKSKSADILRIHGYTENAELLSTLVSLEKKGVVFTADEHVMLRDPSCVAGVLSSKTPDVMSTITSVLKAHGYERYSRFIAVLANLRQDGLISDEECKKLRDLSDLIRMQSSKSPEEVTGTADVLKAHSFKDESELLTDAAVLHKECPTMELLSTLVVPKVSPKWKEVGLYMGLTPNRLQMIEQQHRMMTAKDQCTVMFKKWLYGAPGTGGRNRSWESVLYAVAIGYGQAAEKEIKECLREVAAQTAVEKQITKPQKVKSHMDQFKDWRGQQQQPSQAYRKTVDRDKIPVVFRWVYEGYDVSVCTSFTGWSTKLSLIRSHHGDFSAIVELPQGTHEYKFYVDGKWIHDPCAEMVDNKLGSFSNVVHVTGKDLDAFHSSDILKQPISVMSHVDQFKKWRGQQHEPSQAYRKSVARDKIPVVFRWVYKGYDVCVCTSFTGWSTKLSLIRSHHGDFSAVVELPEGTHEYKFYIDGKWIHDPSAEMVDNQLGSFNNVVNVTKKDVDAFHSSDILKQPISDPIKPEPLSIPSDAVSVASYMDQFKEWRGQQHEPSRAYRKTVDRDKIPVVFRWKYEGYDVCVCTSFTGWSTKLSLIRSHHGDFSTVVELPQGTHEYKFYIDGKWIQDPCAEMVDNKLGSFNNVVNVTKKDLDAFHSSGILRQPISDPMTPESSSIPSDTVSVISHMDKFKEWRGQQPEPSQAYCKTVDKDKIPIVFRWVYKGYDVCVCTSFTGWTTKLSLIRRHRGDSSVVVELPQGTHEYKFYVDGKWILDPCAEIVDNKLGSCNNVVFVTRKDLDAFHSSDILKEPISVMSHMDQFKEWRGQQHEPSQAYRKTVDRDKIPIVFCWKYEGYDVCVCTSFTGWNTKLSLIRSHHGDFSTIVELPQGTHEYKFYVDGKWIHDPCAEMIDNKLGSFNNVVNVTRKDLDAFHIGIMLKQPISGYDVVLEFEEQYSEVVRQQATVTLQITKCTTMGPPCKGKTCLKRLLTGKRGTDEETASMDIMEAPMWVECYGVEEGVSEEPWILLSNDQQQGELFRAVNTILTSTTTTPDAKPSVVGPSATATPTDLEALHSTMPDNASSTRAASCSPLLTMSSSDQLLNITSDAPSTTSPSDTPHTGTAGDSSSTTALSVPYTHSRMPVLDAIACSREALKDFLSDEEGKVLGDVSLIHFIDTRGEAFYHDIRPAFITSPSVYLVVFSLEDLYNKTTDEQLAYFQRELILGPLRSIRAFGTKKPQQKGYLVIHPEKPRIFIIGTHFDKISMKKGCKEFLLKLHEMMSASMNRNSIRQFVQYDSNGRSFWTVDNTQAGKEQDKDAYVSKYISKLRRMIRDKSMEMSVAVPLPWFLLKSVMDSKGFHYCKYSDLLEEACCRGYVREDKPNTETKTKTNTDLDSMLRVFHILGLIYHRVPKGCKKEDSLVFIDPDCLYSSISDFLMAAKAEVESSQAGSSEEDQGQFQAARNEEKEAGMDSEQHKLGPKGIISIKGVIEKMKGDTKIIEDEMEEVLQNVEAAMKKIDEEPTDHEVHKVLAQLHEDLKEIGMKYMSSPRESKDASSLKDKQQMLVGGLVHSLANAVDDSGRKRDVQHIKKAVQNSRTQYQGRSINSTDLEQFLAILTDLRIVAKLKDPVSCVVPAALPRMPLNLVEVTGSADPLLVTVVSQTILEVSYLPSGLFCCLISELVTGLGWTVIPLGRTHVAFEHKTLKRRVHLMEHNTFIKIQIESHKCLPLQELTETCHTVRRSIHESIIRVGNNVYSNPTTGTVIEDSLMWGFQCKVHDSDEPHIAAFQEDEYESWAECLLPSSIAQEVMPEQLVWFSSDLYKC